jgi:hypothetical protein
MKDYVGRDLSTDEISILQSYANREPILLPPSVVDATLRSLASETTRESITHLVIYERATYENWHYHSMIVDPQSKHFRILCEWGSGEKLVKSFSDIVREVMESRTRYLLSDLKGSYFFWAFLLGFAGILASVLVSVPLSADYLRDHDLTTVMLITTGITLIAVLPSIGFGYLMPHLRLDVAVEKDHLMQTIRRWSERSLSR